MFNAPKPGEFENILAEINKPTLYFIGAMKSEGTDTRERFDSVWESIVEPTAEKLGMRAKNALAAGPVQIVPGIISDLLSSYVVVADITGENSSVGYELGIAHSHEKSVVLTKNVGYKCGFDFKDINHVPYSLDAEGIRSAKTELEIHIRHCGNRKWIGSDNPVTYAKAPSLSASLAPETAVLSPISNALALFPPPKRENTLARVGALGSGGMGLPNTSPSKPVPAPTGGGLLARRVRML